MVFFLVVKFLRGSVNLLFGYLLLYSDFSGFVIIGFLLVGKAVLLDFLWFFFVSIELGEIVEFKLKLKDDSKVIVFLNEMSNSVVCC